MFGHPKRFVFIVTNGRSGSTLLQAILNSIEGFEIRGENGNALYGLFQSYSAVVDHHNRFGQQARTANDPWFGMDGVDPNSYGRALADVFVRQILRGSSTTTVLGFKEIRYPLILDRLAAYLDFLCAFFPEAQLVFNFRRLESVAASSWWKESPRAEVIAHLTEFWRVANAYINEKPRACIKVWYDEYARDAEALRPMFEFLRAPFDAAAIQRVLAERIESG